MLDLLLNLLVCSFFLAQIGFHIDLSLRLEIRDEHQLLVSVSLGHLEVHLYLLIFVLLSISGFFVLQHILLEFLFEQHLAFLVDLGQTLLYLQVLLDAALTSLLQAQIAPVHTASNTLQFEVELLLTLLLKQVLLALLHSSHLRLRLLPVEVNQTVLLCKLLALFISLSHQFVTKLDCKFTSKTQSLGLVFLLDYVVLVPSV